MFLWYWMKLGGLQSRKMKFSVFFLQILLIVLCFLLRNKKWKRKHFILELLFKGNAVVDISLAWQGLPRLYFACRPVRECIAFNNTHKSSQAIYAIGFLVLLRASIFVFVFLVGRPYESQWVQCIFNSQRVHCISASFHIQIKSLCVV